MTELEKNIVILQEKIYSVNFDISKSYLPDIEVARKLLLSKNKLLNKDDVSMMLDSTSDTDINSASASVVPKTKEEIDLEKQKSSITKSKEEIKAEKDAAKEKIKQEKIAAKAKAKEEKEKAKAKAKADRDAAKAKAKAFLKENGIYPLSKNNPIYTEVKKIKDEVRESVMLMVREQKELMQSLVKTSVQMANSIAGAAVMIAPLSFNVPGAISLIMLVIDSIAALISKIMAIIQRLGPLKYLPLLLPDNAFESITAPINTAVKVLISIFDSTKFLQKIVNDLIGKLTSALSDLTSQIADLEKQLLGKLSELKDLKKLPFTSIKQIKNKEKEIADIKTNIENMKNAGKLPKTNENGDFEVTSVGDILGIKDDLDKTAAANNQFLEYLYDVHLPDGSIISDLTEEEVDLIKEKYDIIFEGDR